MYCVNKDRTEVGEVPLIIQCLSCQGQSRDPACPRHGMIPRYHEEPWTCPGNGRRKRPKQLSVPRFLGLLPIPDEVGQDACSVTLRFGGWHRVPKMLWCAEERGGPSRNAGSSLAAADVLPCRTVVSSSLTWRSHSTDVAVGLSLWTEVPRSRFARNQCIVRADDKMIWWPGNEEPETDSDQAGPRVSVAYPQGSQNTKTAEDSKLTWCAAPMKHRSRALGNRPCRFESERM